MNRFWLFGAGVFFTIVAMTQYLWARPMEINSIWFLLTLALSTASLAFFVLSANYDILQTSKWKATAGILWTLLGWVLLVEGLFRMSKPDPGQSIWVFPVLMACGWTMLISHALLCQRFVKPGRVSPYSKSGLDDDDSPDGPGSAPIQSDFMIGVYHRGADGMDMLT
jgi:hypothetical protein